jgi:opacity protein-like surface antigen
MILFFDEIVNAQTSSKKLDKKHTQTISIGHGIGNIWKSFLEKGVSIENYKVKSVGPFNLEYEREVIKHFSVGTIISYSKIKGSYDYNGFSFSDQLTIFTALARINYHFIKHKKLDPYVGGGCGYILSKYKNNLNTSSTNIPGEFGYSAQVGLNYFILNNVGLFGEFGYLGGSFVQLGFVLNLSSDSKVKTD